MAAIQNPAFKAKLDQTRAEMMKASLPEEESEASEILKCQMEAEAIRAKINFLEKKASNG
jgi:hypothetical protein